MEIANHRTLNKYNDFSNSSKATFETAAAGLLVKKAWLAIFGKRWRAVHAAVGVRACHHRRRQWGAPHTPFCTSASAVRRPRVCKIAWVVCDGQAVGRTVGRSGAVPRAARREPRAATLPPLPVRCVPRPPCGSRRRAALRSLRLATLLQNRAAAAAAAAAVIVPSCTAKLRRYPHVLSTAQFCSPNSTGGGGSGGRGKWRAPLPSQLLRCLPRRQRAETQSSESMCE